MSAYLQNVSPFGLARIARQQSNARSYFDFRSPKFHHHSSVESLQKAAEIGCYICVLLMKAFMTRCSATELQSLDYDGSFTIYEYENGFEYSKQHPQRFETTIRYQRNASLSIPICPHISVMAFPALDLVKTLGLACTSGNTGSETTGKQVMRWLQGCTKFHARCNTGANVSSWLPTRLIDLGSGTPPSLRLIETSQTPVLGRYATLSYCWGSAATMTLTQGRLSTFLAHLPEPELPKTFQDAIIISRRLGIRCLWIDSLCIMQDSAQDWAAESSTMGRVYRNGLCNISATASKDSNGGLFFDRDTRTVDPVVAVSKFQDCAPITYVVAKTGTWEEEVTDAVLFTRGWVLQERYMAPRIIHFASDQVYWECSELDACEAFPGGFPSKEHSWEPNPGPKLRIKEWEFAHLEKPLEGGAQRPSTRLGSNGYSVWQQIVETYSKTRLTKSRDKLVAISALAKEARQALQDDYLAGLWRQTLAWDLAWSAQDSNNPKPNGYRCPSWSWAAIDGPIYTPEFDGSERLLMKVLAASVTPVGDDDTGKIKSGFVQLQGHLHHLSIYATDLSAVNASDMFDTFINDKTTGRSITRKVTGASPDLDFEGPVFTYEVEECYAMPHHSSGPESLEDSDDEEDYYINALLLIYDGKSMTYSRRGMILLTWLEENVDLAETSRSEGEGEVPQSEEESYTWASLMIRSDAENSDAEFSDNEASAAQDADVEHVDQEHSDADLDEERSNAEDPLCASGTESRIQADDRFSEDNSSSTESQPAESLIRRLRDLETLYYNPDIPCDAYDPNLGYTITVV